MRLQDHPSFFGITYKGVNIMHADWPMYPEEHGAALALLWLTAFPQGTLFKRIDDIDRYNLFLVEVKPSNQKDPFNKRNFHVVIQHEDLLQLQKGGFINGVLPVSERRWEELKRSTLPAEPLFIKMKDGTLKEIQLPSLEEYDVDDASWPEFLLDGITVTTTGRGHMALLLSEASDDLAILGQRIQRLVDLGFYDTAVRDACVQFEHHIKTWLRSERWGDSLLDEFMSRLRDTGDFTSFHMDVLRGQIRMAFKFIRNDFMHNFIEIDETQCRAVLFRLARVQSVVDQLITNT